MFTSSVTGRKVFATEQKIRELKIRIAKLNAQKLKITPYQDHTKFSLKHEHYEK